MYLVLFFVCEPRFRTNCVPKLSPFSCTRSCVACFHGKPKQTKHPPRACEPHPPPKSPNRAIPTDSRALGSELRTDICAYLMRSQRRISYKNQKPVPAMRCGWLPVVLCVREYACTRSVDHNFIRVPIRTRCGTLYVLTHARWAAISCYVCAHREMMLMVWVCVYSKVSCLFKS